MKKEIKNITEKLKEDVKEICKMAGVPALLIIEDIEYLEELILKAKTKC